MIMRVDLFDFDLPQERIALRPADPRGSARMLVVAPDGSLHDSKVRDLPDLLRAGDALVLNDTKVIPAQLSGIRVRGDSVAHIQATLHKRESENSWRAMVRPAKRLAVGERIRFGQASESFACALGTLDAEVVQKREDGEILLRFDLSGAVLDEGIENVGGMPLPSYIAARRQPDLADTRDYQTVFARILGAVAAPTAGLHFTSELLQRITSRGISLHFVTLHVGPGTFLPMRGEDTRDHRMHAERGSISGSTARALNETRSRNGRIVAVGTTSLRILETAAADSGEIHPFDGETSLFITPGYRFKTIDVLMTNFHLPRSTLFMLVSAFAGIEKMRAAYAHAIATGYRFYSYGDATLLFRQSNIRRSED